MERKRKLGLLFLIIGIVLLCASIAIFVGAGIELDKSTGGIVGNISTVNDDVDTMTKKLSESIESLNPDVRTFTMQVIKDDNSGEFNIGQVCDIFDAINDKWVYIQDPIGYEYFAKASESLPVMKGDCDDYSILMASCIESVGGICRINIAYNSIGDGHAYPEVYIGGNQDAANIAVEYIKKRYNCNDVNYTVLQDKDGTTSFWLNLDWWDKQPGGVYFQSVGRILAILSDGSHYTYTLTFEDENYLTRLLKLFQKYREFLTTTYIPESYEYS